ncbi:MAG: hypothetical protein ABSG63_01370 [Spirochaetia bacterium]
MRSILVKAFRLFRPWTIRLKIGEVPFLKLSGRIPGSDLTEGTAEAFAGELLEMLQGQQSAATLKKDRLNRLPPHQLQQSIRKANRFLRKKRLREGLRFLCAQYQNTYDGRIGWAARELSTVLSLDDVSIALLEGIESDVPLARMKLAEIYEKRGLIDQAIQRLRDQKERLSQAQYSFMLQAMLKSPTISSRELLVEQSEWARRFCSVGGLDGKGVFAEPLRGRKVRIGYHCTFWNSDTIRNQLLPVLLKHDRDRFEIFAYTPSALDEHFLPAVDHVELTNALDDDAFVRTVRHHKLDIFLECTGFSPGHRFAAMAKRCAPVQISYLNHTGTSGTPNVDIVIADDISLRSEEECYFTERVLRLPGSFFCFNFEASKQPETGQAPVIKNGYVTFGCFGSNGKINPKLLDWWAEVMKRTPNSVIYIRNLELSPASNRRFLLRKMTDRGIPEARVIVQGGLPRDDLVACYKDVDISLDTWPYCGGNTIAESLWQGVPVISFRGQRFSSAYGASLLASSGCSELVADTEGMYIEKAVRLAHDPGRISMYRETLREKTRTHGFNNAAAFAGKLEQAFLSILTKREND